MKTIDVWNKRKLSWQEVLIDDEDYQRVIRRGNWFLQKNGYVVCNPIKVDGVIIQPAEYLQRFILKLSDENADVDHKDRNRLNNQKDNLRICARNENRRNSGLQVNSKTGFKGVSFHSRDKKYRAYIKVDQKQIHLGNFFTAEEAAMVYDKAAKRYFGEFAVLNFPNH